MRLLDIYPTKGYYRPGEAITLRAHIASGRAGPVSLRLRVLHLADVIDETWQTRPAGPSGADLNLSLSVPSGAPAGYGVVADLFEPSGEPLETAATAFDVLPDWTAYPRYGFLSDFRPGREALEETVAQLARYHINGLQFYDWQYRHDTLVPPADDYNDCLGRQLSLTTVRGLIEAARACNMAALPYLAVYAASAAFWRSRPDWALYDSAGRLIPFGEDFLGIMNPAPGSPWTAHLLEECERVLAALPFDGLHVDQYGDPKEGFDAGGAPVDIPAAFAAFVAAARKRTGRPVLFNAVGNWPIEALAPAPTAFNYIEVWPPQTGYRDLVEIVRNARRLSGGKPTTIALYLHANAPGNNILADALLFACGASRIGLGEDARLLADPYFPKHEAMSEDLAAATRSLYDFAIRYGEWTGPAPLDLDDAALDPVLPEGVWGVARAAGNTTVLHLLNFASSPSEFRWDAPQPVPQPLNRVRVSIALPDTPGRVLYATAPGDPTLEALRFTCLAGRVSVTLPSLNVWGILAFEPATAPES